MRSRTTTRRCASGPRSRSGATATRPRFRPSRPSRASRITSFPGGGRCGKRQRTRSAGSARSRVRIIAGSRKGARIFAPRGDTRPTGDRVREAAFNLIGPVDEMTVLDLFAGSGAMGLEALSRGAETAVFVESDREAQRAIERNLDKLGLTGATVLRIDARRAL